MEIRFVTKEESNARRQEEFLKLSPGERVMSFFELSRTILKFPIRATPDSKHNNFVLKKKGKWDLNGRKALTNLFLPQMLSLNDLLESKRRAARPKDLLDIQQLKSINK